MDIIHIEVKSEPFLFHDTENDTYAISNIEKNIVIQEGIKTSTSNIDTPNGCKTLLKVETLDEYDCNIQHQYPVPVRQYKNKRKSSFQSEQKKTFVNNDLIELQNHANTQKLPAGNIIKQNMSSLTVKRNDVIDLPLPYEGQFCETYVLDKDLRISKCLLSRYNQQEHVCPYRLNQNKNVNWNHHTTKLKTHDDTYFPEKKLNSNKVSSSSTDTNSIQYISEVKEFSYHEPLKDEESKILQTNISLEKSQVYRPNPHSYESQALLVQNDEISLILHSSTQKQCQSCYESFVSEKDFILHKMSCNNTSCSHASLQQSTSKESVKQESDVALILPSSAEKQLISSNYLDNNLTVHLPICVTECGADKLSFENKSFYETYEQELNVKHKPKTTVKQYKNKKRHNFSLNNTNNINFKEILTGMSMSDKESTLNMTSLEMRQLDFMKENYFSFNSLSNVKTDEEQFIEKYDSSVLAKKDNENTVFLPLLEKIQKDSNNKISLCGNNCNVAEEVFTTCSDFLLPRKQDQDGTLLSSGLKNNQCSSSDQAVVSQNNSTFCINPCQSIRQPSQNKTLMNNGSRKIYVLCPLKQFKQKLNKYSFYQKTKLMSHNTLQDFVKSFANDKTLSKVNQIGKRKSKNREPTKKKPRPRKYNTYYLCTKCDKQIPGFSHFKRHLRKHENEGNFQCNKCNKFFKKISTFKKHSTRTDCDKMFKCKRCHKKFNSNNKLREHLRTDDENQCIPSGEWEYYYCSTCCKGFPDKDKLRYHLQTHNGVTHKCPICDKSFNNKNVLGCHMKVHSAKSVHLCELCGKKYWSKVSLNKHLNLHKYSKSFQCSVCGVLFSSDANLQRHSELHTDEPQFQCAYCHKKFFQKQALGYHLKSCNISEAVQNKIDRQYHRCPICNKFFYRTTRYIEHLNVHAGNKSQFSCPICNKGFTNKYYLPRHLKSHKGEKPLKCPVCSRRFLSKSNFNRHMDLHSEKKKYLCNICNKGFAQQQVLGIHINAHKGLKPYQCSTCNRRFLERGTLIRHLRTHFQKKLNES